VNDSATRLGDGGFIRSGVRVAPVSGRFMHDRAVRTMRIVSAVCMMAVMIVLAHDILEDYHNVADESSRITYT